MKTLYLDCHMGAAGDMLTAALLELLPEPETFVKKLNQLEIPGVCYQTERVTRCGITGTHMVVTVDGMEEESIDHHEHSHHHEQEELHHTHQDHKEHTHAHHHEHDQEEHTHAHHHEQDHEEHTHHHSSMADIERIVSQLSVSEKVKQGVLAVYQLIAEAESQVHGKQVSEIHFHEVGTMDAIADVTAVCMLMEELDPQRVVASEIHVGSGQVKCAHGILPVPAPATALLLQGIPTYGGEIKGELCTPSGAALLKYFVQEYGSQPQMKVEKIGYGCGKKEFPCANAVRALLGETDKSKHQVLELSCNLDDMTPEAVGFVTELLMEQGALDVYTTAIGMKKNRPGIILTCMCREEKREEMLRLMFRHTTTIGIREALYNRYVLDRQIEQVDTIYGQMRKKRVSGFGTERVKWEYEDLAKAARDQKMTLAEVEKNL